MDYDLQLKLFKNLESKPQSEGNYFNNKLPIVIFVGRLSKTKKINLYYQPYDITKSSEVYLEAYNQYKLMKKEKLLDPGGDKHLNLERKLNEYFYKNYKKMKKKQYDGSVETYNMVCEL